MDQSTLIQGVQFDTSLALRGKVLSLYSLDTNTDAVSLPPFAVNLFMSMG